MGQQGARRANQALPADFHRLVLSWAGSLSGDGLRVVALPLLAAAIQPSPAAVAAVAVATTLPWLLVAIPAGALADRFDPARAVAAAHLLRALLTGALVAAIAGGIATIPLLCAVGFGLTAAETLADATSQSLLVGTVPVDQLEHANARFATVETLALDMVGPLSAGLLFHLAPWLPFAVSALCFLLASLLVLGIRVDRSSGVFDSESVDGVAESEAAPKGAMAMIKVGLQRIWTDPVLRVLVLSVAVMATANAAMDAVLVLYATSSLHMSERLFPTLLAAYSVGILLAAGLVPRLSRRLRSGRLMLAAMAGIGGTMLVMGLVQHRWVAWAAFLAMGIAGGTWNVLSATRRQRRTPVRMVARVSSAFRVIAWGVMPIGAGLGGWVGERWGVPEVFLAGGVVIAVLMLVVGRHFARTEVTAVSAGKESGKESGTDTTDVRFPA